MQTGSSIKITIVWFLSGYQFNQQMNGGGGVFFPGGFTGFNGGGGTQMSSSAPHSQGGGGQGATAPLQRQLFQIGETVVMTTSPDAPTSVIT